MTSRIRLAVLVGLALSALIVVIAGCGGGGSSTASSSGTTTAASESSGSQDLAGKKIAFANLTEAAPQFVTFREHLEEAAGKLGVDLTTYDNESDTQKTLSNAQVIAQSEAETVLEYSPDAAVAQSLEAAFSRGGKKCIAVNISLGSECSWFDLSNQTLCGDTGKYVGMVADKKGWNGSNTDVILVDAAALGEPVNTCIGFYYEELQKQVEGLAPISSYKDIKPTTTAIGSTTVQVDGEALREPTFKAVQGALQNVPADHNVIVYTVSDDSAVGAWRALQQSGRASKSLIAGLTGEKEGIEQLRHNPQWVAQGTVFYNQWGQYLLAMVKAIEEGQTLPTMTSAPTAVLTKEDTIPGTTIAAISKYYKPDSTEPYKLPPLEPVKTGETSGLGRGQVGNEYLLKTGVLQEFGQVPGT